MDFLTRAREVAAYRLSLAAADCLEHMREWEQVEAWLEDQTSRENYHKELAFWVLRRMFGTDIAVQYAGALSPAEWNNALNATKSAREQNAIPALRTTLPGDHPLLLYAQATSFILNQYEYNGLVGIREGDVVLDCGACFGETALRARMAGAARVYSFEPNPDSFACLQANAERYDPERTWFFPVPLALGDKNGVSAFQADADHPGASSFAEDGAVRVNMTTLDDWCGRNGVAPDFVKMDLEGAEDLALLGAQQVFRSCRPRFAVCLYHKLEHMWQLPRLLKALVPEYKLWCKKSAPASEFVLFGAVS